MTGIIQMTVLFSTLVLSACGATNERDQTSGTTAAAVRASQDELDFRFVIKNGVSKSEKDVTREVKTVLQSIRQVPQTGYSCSTHLIELTKQQGTLDLSALANLSCTSKNGQKVTQDLLAGLVKKMSDRTGKKLEIQTFNPYPNIGVSN